MSSSTKKTSGKVEALKEEQRKEQESRVEAAVQKLYSNGKAKKTRGLSTPDPVPMSSLNKEETPRQSKRTRISKPSSPGATAALKYESFVVDCDGVMWHGDEAIPGSFEACNRLLENNCKLHFVTNSSSNTRKAVAEKLKKLGLKQADPEWVTTSGSAAASLLQSEFKDVKKVYVVGEQGLVDELRLAGLTVEGGPKDNNADASTSGKFSELPIDKDVQAVVCGLDRRFNYAKLAKASLYLQRGCPLICTNNDAYDVLPQKGNVPGAACMAAALKASCPEVQKVERLAGKPSGTLLLQILSDRKMDKIKTVVIGDRVDTDVEFAHNAGVFSCLVLSGVSSEMHREKANTCHETLGEFVETLFSPSVPFSQ